VATTPVDQAAQWVERALALRSTRIAQLATQISTSKSLTSTARATLSSLVANDAAEMTVLTTTISSATTLPVVQSTAATMIDGYHVLAIVAPEVHDVIDAAGQASAVSGLQALEPAIEAAITTDQQGGRSATRAQALYRELTTSLANVASTDASDSTLLLALVPSNYSFSNAVLTTAQVALTGASTRLVTARADLRRIVQLLAAQGLSA
jgi:hypothetical protein